jgi:exopolysaccharide biosynthesis polyprenyl glycosylphosphotransferase
VATFVTDSHSQTVDETGRPVRVVTKIFGELRFAQGDLVFLVDLFVLLAAVSLSGFVNGSLDLSTSVFGIVALTLIVFPQISRERLRASVLDDVGPIFRRICIAYAVSSAFIVVMGLSQMRHLLIVAAFTYPALIAGRGTAYALERSLRRRGRRSRALVVGGGLIARRLVSTLAEHGEYGLEVMGVADHDPRLSTDELGAEVLGDLSDVPYLVTSRRIDVVIVAFSSSEQASMVDVIRAAMARGAQVWVIPRFFELGYASPTSDHLWGLPVVRLQTPARIRPAWILKRAMDFSLAGLGILTLSPLLAIIAAAICLESGRPIFFKQRRVGLDGRDFYILKFRTMAVRTDEVTNEEWAADTRSMTRLGRFLRDNSLDELPQLFNVLRGEMSLVGPRPERPHFVRMFSQQYPNYESRHRLPAGVTGWAQVHGLRGDTSIEERVSFDNFYIENWSFTRDVKILAKTVASLPKKWK